MVRIIIISLILVFFNSCIRLNEYGYYRVGMSKFTITPNTNDSVYSVIDTNVIYRFYKEEKRNISGLLIPSYRKFYTNGRVAKFYDRNVNLKMDTILESKKGYMGYYSYDKNKIIIQFYNNNANASELMTEEVFVNKDTLISLYRGIENSERKTFFIKEKIPKNVRITKPDW